MDHLAEKRGVWMNLSNHAESAPDLWPTHGNFHIGDLISTGIPVGISHWNFISDFKNFIRPVYSYTGIS